jgi:TonB family protein
LKKFIISFFISIIIHFLLIINLYFEPLENDISFELKKGLSVSFQSGLKKEDIGRSTLSSSKENQNINNEELGIIDSEINEIKNAIQYPPDALEQGLESECEWKVLIGKGGVSSRVELNRPCRYKIFEKEFMRVIGSWKFKSPENTWLEIPVRFKIERESDG